LIYNKLYDWQKTIVDTLSQHRMAGLWLDCGLGKTVQALALAECNKADKVLIITPNCKACETVKTPGSWHKWATELGDPPGSFTICDKKTKPTEFAALDKCVYIINYEALFDRKTTNLTLKPTIKAFIESCKFKSVTLLLDESHYIKDPASTQAKALVQIKRELILNSKTFHAYLLTGTPFTRGFIDVWNQLRFLGCDITKTQFKDRFCVIGNIRGLLGWQQPIVGYKNVDDLYKVIHKYAITIKSEDVLKLPEQVFTEHICQTSPWFKLLTRKTLPERQLLSINKTRKSLGLPYLDPPVPLADSANPWFRNIDYPETAYLCDTPGALWMRARQLSIGFQGNAEQATWYSTERFDKIEQFLKERPGNYVLFYNYVPEFLSLFEICQRLGYKVDVYNGDIKSLDNYTRYESEAPSQRVNDTCNIILSNFASGSTGMNWQAYHDCIIASLPTYKHWAQGLKRVHRNGSTETVNYHVFKADNWLDKGMWDALMSNTEYSQEMFDKELNKFCQ
jgi:hypothetical protein